MNNDISTNFTGIQHQIPHTSLEGTYSTPNSESSAQVCFNELLDCIRNMDIHMRTLSQLHRNGLDTEAQALLQPWIHSEGTEDYYQAYTKNIQELVQQLETIAHTEGTNDPFFAQHTPLFIALMPNGPGGTPPLQTLVTSLNPGDNSLLYNWTQEMSDVHDSAAGGNLDKALEDINQLQDPSRKGSTGQTYAQLEKWLQPATSLSSNSATSIAGLRAPDPQYAFDILQSTPHEFGDSIQMIEDLLSEGNTSFAETCYKNLCDSIEALQAATSESVVLLENLANSPSGDSYFKLHPKLKPAVLDHTLENKLSDFLYSFRKSIDDPHLASAILAGDAPSADDLLKPISMAADQFQQYLYTLYA